MTKVDPVLEAIGGRGKYQFMTFFLTIFAAMSASFQLLNIVFVGRNIPHVCKQPTNVSDIYDAIDSGGFHANNSFITYEQCNIRVVLNDSAGNTQSKELPCMFGWEYEERQDLSIMSYFDIVCDNAPLRSLGQTFLILGQGIGSLILTYFSDKYGRRTLLVFSHCCFLVVGTVIAFVPYYTMFLVLRVPLGMFQQGIVLGYSTISVEVFSTRYRRFGGLITSLTWSFCACCIPLVAYLMRDYSWRYTQLAYCSVSLYSIVQFFFLDESLTWLVTNRKTKQVEKVLKKAARISGKDFNAVLKVYREYQEREDKELQVPQEENEAMEEKAVKPVENGNVKGEEKKDKEKDETKPTFLQLLKRKRLAFTVAVLWFTWFTDAMTYFGVYMTSHALAGDRYLNVLLLSFVDAPAVLIFFFMVDRYGRKKTSVVLHGIAGIGLISATVIRSVGIGSWADIAVTIFSSMGMFGAAGAWNVTFFFTPEMFPTNLRNFGLGTSSAFSRIGGMIAPFSSLLVDYVPWAPGAIFGGFCLAVTVVVNFLPETMGRALPQTLDDMAAWYKKSPEKKQEERKMKEMGVLGVSYKIN